MRKITFLLFALLFSFVGYSQFPTPGAEGFESTSGPDIATPVAMSPWTLGTGATGNQWAVFDNGVSGSPQRRWDRATTNFYSGAQAAFINRKQNGGAGITSEDYLATPLVTVPTNGLLQFYTRTGFNITTVDPIDYIIKINTITTAGSQTTPANYTITAQSWNQTTIAATYNIYELKTVDLSAYAGQQVYIAFVKKYTQPGAAQGGNSWYVDDVKLVPRCVDPTVQTASNFSTTTANLSWTPNGSTSWEIEVVPVTGTPTGVGTVYNGTLPYVVTGLTPTTCYVYYVRAKCTDSDSNWVGPYNFCTSSPGLSCASPISIGGLPYCTTDNTSNYGDTYDVAQPTACAGTATNYMTGNDVFYSYTPTTTGAISITMTPGGTWSGIFVYQGCSNVGLTCVGGVANSGSGVRSIPSLNVTAGLPYIIVISTNAAPQTVAYTLCIQQVNCAQPTALGASGITTTDAVLGWTNPTSTSWEYVVQTAGSAIPTGSGITTTSSTNTPVTGLTPDTSYQFWVRADCGDGTFSAWSGPFPFKTLVPPPVCGGLFVDAGGQTGNYANNVTAATGTTTICPAAGEQVTVTFTAFNTQLNTDLLKVYNGNGTTGTLLATYSGTTIPPAVTSSSPDGCLTFVFTSNATTNAAGWVANVTCAPAPGCQKPIVLATSAVLYNSVTLGWTQTPNPDTSLASQWEVIALTCGSPAPTAATTGTVTSLNPFTFTGLLPLTCYDFYVRAVCSTTSSSSWSSLLSVTTPIAPPICGGNFVDPGGTTANYANNANVTTTITPVNAGDQVTVTFTAFNTQLNTDLLKVYDGTSAAGTLLATYSGTTIPPSITSSSPNGSLTFVFTSNATTTAAGWIANVTCAPAPACQKPIVLTTSSILANSVTVGWTQTQNPDTSLASSWEVITLPCGSPAPTATSTGIITSTNSLVVTGLTATTCYDFYVRAVCSSSSSSAWTGPTSATTAIGCGGQFVNVQGPTAGTYPNSSDSTVTICPSSSGQLVTVTFTSFATETNWDGLYVFDGNSITAPLLASANGAGNVPGGVAGSYWGTLTGTNLPGPFTSSSVDGCLTFRFRSDTSGNTGGWAANVTCAPAPTCTKPITLIASPVTSTTATLSWTQLPNPDTSIPSQWEVFVQPAGTGYPSASAVGVLTSTASYVATSLTPGVNYEYYVRTVCSTTDSSVWVGPKTFSTPLCDNGCNYTFIVRDSFGDGWNGNTMSVIQNGITIATLTGPTAAQGTTPQNVLVALCPLLPFQLVWNAGGTFATEVGVSITSFLGDVLYTHAPGTSLQNTTLYTDVSLCQTPTCPRPTTLLVTVINSSSASLSWTEVGTATQWEVFVQPAGTGYPSASAVGVLVTSPSYTAIGLASDTNYEYYVRAVCSTTDSSVWGGPKPFTTPISCPKPTAVLSVSTSISTATVSWTSNGVETQWEILVLPAGSSAPTAGSIGIIVSTNPANLSGLTVGTFYDVYVRAICGSTDISTWSNLSVLYVTPPLPSCAGVDLNLTTNNTGVLNICPDNNCVNLAATYTQTFTTSSYVVASTPYVPLFPFTGGTQVSVNTDDIWSGDVTIPFKFCFYGNTYTALNIGSNGVVTFNTHTAGSNCPWMFTATIPNATFPVLNAIYAPYQDVNPGVLTAPAQPNINYQVLGTAPCRVMVINFSKLAQFSCGVSVGIQTSQVVLYETSNVIDIYVKDRTACTTWNSGSGVIGIQNTAGTNAVVPPGRNTGTWSATNEAWRFLPNGASNVTFAWLQDGAPLTTNANITVCATANTNLTAQATYTACDGTQVIKSQNVLLNLVNQITPVFTQLGPLCQNSTPPTLSLASNDVPAITGTWSPAIVDTTTAGTTTYTFTPTTGQCALPTTMNITILPGVVPVFITPAPICSGATAPVLPTSSSNTPTAITGTWNPPTVSNTTSGTYTFTPDSGQCASTTTLNVTINTNCSFGSYASAVWLTNCGTSNFFNTVGSGTSIIGPVANVFPNANLGTYVQNSNSLILRGAELKTFKVSASNVCSARLNYRVFSGTPSGTFQVMDLPWFSNCGVTNQFDIGSGPCNSGDQKWQRVVADGTTTPYSPVNLTAYPPGNYTIQVYYDIFGSASSTSLCDENVLIDNNGAYYSATFTIQATPAYASTNPTTCSGTSGTITISGLAPNTTYGLTYSHNSTVVGPTNLTSNALGEILINGLNAATYSNFLLTVNSCSYPNNTPIVLVDPALPTVTVNSATVCVGSSATFAATTSTGTFSYVWTVPSGTNPGNVPSFTTSALGTYSVIITDTVTGCSSASASGVLNTSSVITPTFDAIAPICSGSTAPTLPTSSTNTPTAINGTWLPSVIDTAIVGNTTYTFTPDAGQCSEPISVVVTVNSVPTPTANIVTQPTCATPTGTVEITSPVSSLGTLPTDLFISEVTDAETGSLTYVEIFNGTGTSKDLSNYKLKIYNNGNTTASCDLSLTGIIANNATNVIKVSADANQGLVVPNQIFSGCGGVNNNDNIRLTTSSGVVVDNWGRQDGVAFTPLTQPGYTYRRHTTATPLPNPSSTWNAADWDAIDPEDYTNVGNFAPLSNAQYNYSVDSGTYQSNPIFSGLTPGVHIFTVQDAATGCTNTVSVTLNQPVFNPSETSFTYTSPVCTNSAATLTPNTSVVGFTSGGTFTVTLGTGLVIDANTGIIDLVNSLPGTYEVTYSVNQNPALCLSASSTPFTLVINALPTATVNSPAVCAGLSATVTATTLPTGTYSYVWTVPAAFTNPGDVASFTTTVAGVYSVIVTNAITGCSSTSASGTVTIIALPTVTVNSPTVCQGTNAVVTATPSPSGTYTYVWTVPSGINPGNVDHFTATVSGNYGITITNSTTGCTSVSASSTVTINSNPVVTVTGDSVCQGTLATISASTTPSGTYTYLWTVPSGTNPGNVASFTTAIAGTYSVIATNTTTGCSSLSDSGVATIAPAFDFVITDGCVNNNFTLEVVPTGSSFDVNTATVNWQYNGTPVTPNGTTFDVTAYLNSTTVVEPLPLTFTAVVTSNNCQQTHSIVLDRIYCEIQKGISPNNDGKNDYFDLRLMNVQQLNIFNRYGTKVYSKFEYSNEWVGQSDAGNELPDGTYYYVIEFKDNQASKTGWIYINRENK